MKKTYILLTIIFVSTVISVNGFSRYILQNQILKGNYSPHLPLKSSSLHTLPIPRTSRNYTFLQCINKTCTIVNGVFATVPRRIEFFQDVNVDGKVDIAYRYYIDLKKYKKINNISKVIPPKKFKELKEIIFSGQRGKYSPNLEGIDFFKILAKDGSNIHKWRNGFSVFRKNVDKIDEKRAIYSFSDNGPDGYDIVFKINYMINGRSKIVPVIKSSVYAKNSKDPFIKSKIKELYNMAKKNYSR